MLFLLLLGIVNKLYKKTETPQQLVHVQPAPKNPYEFIFTSFTDTNK